MVILTNLNVVRHRGVHVIIIIILVHLRMQPDGYGAAIYIL